jgi:hypothetical protein
LVLDNACYNHSAEIKAYVSGRRLPDQAGLPAGLCAEPQPDRIASYRHEIQPLISSAFHYIGKQNPQPP